MDATLPAFDPAAALAVHVQARATAGEVECRDASCKAATSHPETCVCACRGADHGKEQDRTGLGPAAPRPATPAGQPSYAMRSLMAAMPATEAAPTPRRVATYAIHLDADEVW